MPLAPPRRRQSQQNQVAASACSVSMGSGVPHGEISHREGGCLTRVLCVSYWHRALQLSISAPFAEQVMGKAVSLEHAGRRVWRVGPRPTDHFRSGAPRAVGECMLARVSDGKAWPVIKVRTLARTEDGNVPCLWPPLCCSLPQPWLCASIYSVLLQFCPVIQPCSLATPDSWPHHGSSSCSRSTWPACNSNSASASLAFQRER
ncbi:hypothetical protein BCV70DRAFT_97117 [Testicularia cyperi]|uniref:Uncharacterized protein n=1 Tax=Testicularia cyperi TaxID=1882483 RepID=A0A317XQ93_9BASI|nr:hypothetical protein BCV70DRAFT_97117 [Testicularia cyperi]